MGDEYQVKTHIFEGPLDTLLSLIEKRKLFINDISLAQVADDYIAYIKSLENFPIADSAHFILIASTLVLIKSKSLLPNLELSEEEQHSIEDLEARLAEYQKYKALAVHLRDRFGIVQRLEFYHHDDLAKIVTVFAPDKNMTVSRMRESIRSIILQMPKKEFVPKAIVQKVISLEETMSNLSERITASLKMSFKDFAKMGKTDLPSYEASARQEKLHVIVSFLAMLELVKQGIISVRQDKDFHDIEMETQSTGVPHY